MDVTRGTGAPHPSDVPHDAAATSDERREDLVALLVAAGSITTVSAVGAALQTAWAYSSTAGAADPFPPMSRVLANLLAVVVALVALAVLRVHVPRPVPSRLARLLGAGAVTAGVRLALLAGFGVPLGSTWPFELAGGMPVVWVGGAVGLVAVDAQRRLRARATQVAQRTQQAASALAALAEEELRVRRAVAEGLHGTAQHRLTLAVRLLDDVVSAPGTEVDPRWRAVAAAVRDDLDDVRETDVRALSRLLYARRQRRCSRRRRHGRRSGLRPGVHPPVRPVASRGAPRDPRRVARRDVVPGCRRARPRRRPARRPAPRRAPGLRLTSVSSSARARRPPARRPGPATTARG